eukprot:2263985-Amphidinium_carterae.1
MIYRLCAPRLCKFRAKFAPPEIVLYDLLTVPYDLPHLWAVFCLSSPVFQGKETSSALMLRVLHCDYSGTSRKGLEERSSALMLRVLRCDYSGTSRKGLE